MPINGGSVGLAALGPQLLTHHLLGGNSTLASAAASALTYVPLIIINFMIHRQWLFKHHAIFWHFVLANPAIMVLVSLMSLVCRYLNGLAIGAS